MNELISGAIQMARIEGGKITLRRETFPISELLRNVTVSRHLLDVSMRIVRCSPWSCVD